MAKVERSLLYVDTSKIGYRKQKRYRVTYYTAHTNINAVRLRKPLPLLCCFAITNAAPEDTKAASEDL